MAWMRSSGKVSGAFRGSRKMGVALGSLLLLASSTAVAAPPYEDAITPGQLRGISLRAGEAWNYGYWEYLPSNYGELGPDERLPLLVFLAGIGEFDNPSVCPDDADVCEPSDCGFFGGDGLCRNLRWGPQAEIRQGRWDEEDRPFIVVSPQNPAATLSNAGYSVDRLDAFFDYMIANYPVDPRRIYLVGMSQGGRYTLLYAAEHPRRVTAIAPTPAGRVDPDAACRLRDTALWVFHGEDDDDANLGAGTFDPCWMAGQAYMYNNPEEFAQFDTCLDRADGEPFPEGRITMFADVAHASWLPSVRPDPLGFDQTAEWTTPIDCLDAPNEYREYTAALDPDGMYSWFLGLDRPALTVPETVEADWSESGVEVEVVVEDDDALTFSWTQTGGETVGFSVTPSGGLRLDAVPRSGGTFDFEVLAVDADNQWDRGSVQVVVAPASDEGGSSSGAVSSGGEGSSSGSIDASSGGEGTSSVGSTGGAASTSGSAEESTSGTGSAAADAGTTGETSGTGGAPAATSSTGAGTLAGETDDDASGGGETFTSGGGDGVVVVTGGEDGAVVTTGAGGGTTGEAASTSADPETSGSSSGAGEVVDDGCSCRTDGASGRSGWMLLLALPWLRRRTRRRRAS